MLGLINLYLNQFIIEFTSYLLKLFNENFTYTDLK